MQQLIHPTRIAFTFRNMIGFSALPFIAIAMIHAMMLVESFRPLILPSHRRKSPVFLSRRKATKIMMNLGPSKPRSARFTQVVSDVDDTLKSSGGVSVGGVALGGVDVQYERGDFYPGVGEFMLELSRYGLPKESSSYPAKIAVLTARAEEFKAALEIKDESKLAVALRSAGEKAGIEGWGVSQLGISGAAFVGYWPIDSLTLRFVCACL
jgi:hypothetical protein